MPLKASFEFDSAVQADCLSKSTLRVAAHEILAQGIENVFYWPSFEIVRWLSSHTESPFGKDDQNNLHVNEDIINLIMELFIENHIIEEDQLFNAIPVNLGHTLIPQEIARI